MRTLTALAATAALVFSLHTNAFAVWVSVAFHGHQVQRVCRDGMIIDLGDRSQTRPPLKVYVADPAVANASEEYFYTASVPVQPMWIDIPEMWGPVDEYRSMTRNSRLQWQGQRVPGSAVLIATGGPGGFERHPVQSCLVHDRVDPFTVGYVLAHRPTVASYTPDAYWSYNSTMRANTVIRTGVGAYTVEFPGLAGAGGNAHVTAVANVLATCKIAPTRWYASGTAIRLDVRCFNAAGAPADSRFTASYNSGYGSGNTMAFAWAHQPTTASYPAHNVYQYNNSGGAITVTRDGPGDYKVWMPNIHGPLPSGTVKVTAIGAAAVACKADKWSPATTHQVAIVRCHAPNGVRTDQQFTIAYQDGMNIVGSNIMATAYVRADQPLTASYTPPLAYQEDRTVTGSGSVAVRRVAVGTYDVMLPRQQTSFAGGAGAGWDGGTVHVTAYGPDPARCQIGYWRGEIVEQTSGRVVRVRCFAVTGAAADAMFTLQYTAQIQ